MNTRELIRRAFDGARNVYQLATAKRARKIRTADEFDVSRLVPTVRSPIIPQGAFSWDLPAIMSARDEQINGRFAWPVRLAEAMRTDDAVFSALQNRLAPQRCVGIEMIAGRGPGASIVCKEAEAIYGVDGVGMSPETLVDINRDLALHGVAIAVNLWTPRADGSRVDVEVHSFPIEFVWWNQPLRYFMARVDPYPQMDVNTFGSPPGSVPKDRFGEPPFYGSNMVPVVHGDGRWIVFTKNELLPFRSDAALPALATIWGAHAYALKDWAKGSASHGNAKVVGTLPEGFQLQANGDVSPDAESLLTLLEAIAGEDTPIGIKPFGSTVDYLTNSSHAWEVWERLALNREKAAHRVLCGTDAALGSQGGGPGIDVKQMFGVTNTIVQGDLSCLQRRLLTGSIEPWTAINFGSSSTAPVRKYLIPDSDEAEIADQAGKQQTAYIEAVANLKTAGITLTQDLSDELAEAYHATPITIPPENTAATRNNSATLTTAIKTIIDLAKSAGLQPTKAALQSVAGSLGMDLEQMPPGATAAAKLDAAATDPATVQDPAAEAPPAPAQE